MKRARVEGTQQKLARLVAEGYTNQELANRLCLTYGTVSVYMRLLYAEFGIDRKYKTNDRRNALVQALRQEMDSGQPKVDLNTINEKLDRILELLGNHG